MTLQTEIIAMTRWTTGKKGIEYPSRYVVLAWKNDDGAIVEYSRHMQVNDGKHDDYFTYGHYYGDCKSALNDLRDTVIKLNKDFPEGNPSHIPGTSPVIDADKYPIGAKYLM